MLCVLDWASWQQKKAARSINDILVWNLCPNGSKPGLIRLVIGRTCWHLEHTQVRCLQPEIGTGYICHPVQHQIFLECLGVSMLDHLSCCRTSKSCSTAFIRCCVGFPLAADLAKGLSPPLTICTTSKLSLGAATKPKSHQDHQYLLEVA